MKVGLIMLAADNLQLSYWSIKVPNIGKQLALIMDFSNIEKRDMLKVYYSCHRNSQVASQMYLEEYPYRRQPSTRYFKQLDEHLCEFGAFNKPRSKYGSRIRIDDQEGILNLVIQFFYC